MTWFARTVCTALITISFVWCVSAAPAPQTSPSVPSASGIADGSPEHAAQAFLRAFNQLEWDRFRSFLADDMTMFFPFAQTQARVDGREAVEKVFEGFFRGKRQQLADAGAPISQGLNPRDLNVQLAGPDAAVITFHLGSEKSPARRSLVLRRTAGEWKVIHWHASGISTAAPES